MTLSPAQLEQRRAAGRKGGAERAKAFTPDYQSAARAQVKPESLTTSARLGHLACQRKFGAHYSTRRLARWRASHPTALIRTVCGWLNEMWIANIGLDVEIVPGQVYADIRLYWQGRALIIECDGEHWHDQNDHVGEDRPARDRERDEMIRASGYELLHLTEAEIKDGSGRARLVAFLEKVP
jgi:hypothetical protein